MSEILGLPGESRRGLWVRSVLLDSPTCTLLVLQGPGRVVDREVWVVRTFPR